MIESYSGRVKLSPIVGIELTVLSNPHPHTTARYHLRIPNEFYYENGLAVTDVNGAARIHPVLQWVFAHDDPANPQGGLWCWAPNSVNGLWFIGFTDYQLLSEFVLRWYDDTIE